MNENCLRVYVTGCSTDTASERKALQDYVFPKLETWCEHKNVQLHVTDMRYKNNTDLSIDVCLDEIDKSSVVIGIYGSRLDPVKPLDDTSAKEFPWLTRLPTTGNSKGLSISQIEIQRATLNEDPYRRPLLDSASYDFYYFRNNNFLERDNVPLRLHERFLPGTYKRVAGQLIFTHDTAQLQLFESMKKKVINQAKEFPNLINVSNDYTCRFNGRRSTDIEVESALGDLGTFCTTVAKDIASVVTRMFPQITKPIPSAINKNVIDHQRYFRSTLKRTDANETHPNMEQEKQILNYIRPKNITNTMSVCIVAGEDGIGKSTMISNLVNRLDPRTEPCIFHMVQASSLCSNIRYTLFSLSSQLQTMACKLNRTNFDENSIQFSDMATYLEAKSMFINSLRVACEAAEKMDTLITLIIDGIDDFVEGQGPFTQFDWLPDWRPSVIGEESSHWLNRLRLIVTLRTKTGTSTHSEPMKALKQRCQGKGRFIEQVHLDIVPNNMILGNFQKEFRDHSKHTNIEEEDIIIPKHCHAVGVPRCLNYSLYMIAQPWSSIQTLDGIPILPVELCDRLLYDLEEIHGSEIIQKLMTTIACSYGGLYRNELVSVTKVNVSTLVPILYKLKPFLKQHFIEVESQLNFDLKIQINSSSLLEAIDLRYFDWTRRRNMVNLDSPYASRSLPVSYSNIHEQLAFAFRNKCFNLKFAKDNKEEAINKAIMDAQGGDGSLTDVLNMAEREGDSNIWLRTTRSHRRGLVCLPYHLLKAKCFNYVYDLMTDLHYISACCTANLTFECIFFIKMTKRVMLWGRANQRGWAGLKNLLFGGGGGKKKKKVHTIKNEHLSRLREFITFLENYAKWLTIQPYQVFQCAANTPLNTAPGSSASDLWHDSMDRTACWMQNAVLFTTLAITNPDEELADNQTNKASKTVQRLIDLENKKKAAQGEKKQEDENLEIAEEEEVEVETEEAKNEMDEDGDGDGEEQKETKVKTPVQKSKKNSKKKFLDGMNEVREKDLGIVMKRKLQFLDVVPNKDEKELCAGFRRWVRWINKATAADPCLRSLNGHTGKVNALAFAPTSNNVGARSLLASASDDMSIRIWNQSGECLNIFKSHEDAVTDCKFCPCDLKTLVSSSIDGTLKYWDVFSSKLIYTYADETDRGIMNNKGIITFSWSADGKRICYGCRNGDVAIVRVKQNEMVLESKWNAHNGEVTSCIMIEDNLLTASVEDRTFRVWNISTAEEMLRKVGEPLHISLLANDQQGTNLARNTITATTSESIDNQRSVNTSTTNNNSTYNSTAVVILRDSATGMRVVSLSSIGPLYNEIDPTVLNETRGDTVTACAISKSVVVHATSKGDLRVFNRYTGKPLGSGVLCGHMTAVTAVAFSDDETVLVSGESDGSIRLWNPRPLSVLDQKFADVIVSNARGNGAAVVGIDSQHLEFAPSLATVLHPSSVCSSILVTRADGAVELLNAETGQFCTQLRPPIGTLREPATFAKDCRRVLTVNDGFVLLHPVPPDANPIVARGAKEAAPSLNSLAHQIDMNVQTVGAWALAPDSICMAMAGGVKPHHISSYINGEAKLLLKYGISTLPGSIGWMQDNHGCLLAIFSGHWSMITKLAFSHEGKNLISCGRAMEILIWDTHHVKRIDSRSFGSKSRKNKTAARLGLLSILMPMMHTGTMIKSFSLSPDGFFMLTRQDSKVAVLWDLQETYNHTPKKKDIQDEVKRRNETVLSKDELVALKKGKIEGVTESAIAAEMMRREMKHSPGGTTIYGHHGKIMDMAWAPSNEVFATGSMDGTIRVTRAHDNHLTAVLGSSTSQSPIIACRFTVNATIIVSISEDHEIRIWRSPLYNEVPTLAKITGITGANVSWAMTVPTAQPLPPSMIYKLIDRPTCLTSSFSMKSNPRITVGDSGGKVNIFEIVDVISRPPPVVTAQRQSRLRQQRIAVDKFLSVTCPGCNLIFNLSTVPAHAIKILQQKCRGEHNNRNIDKEFYTDPRLLTYCQRCKLILRLNPFDSHLPFKFRTEVRQLSPRRPTKKKKKERKASSDDDEDGNGSDGDSSTGTDSPEISSFIRRKPSRKFKFNIVAFKPQAKDELANKNAIESNKSRNRSKSKKNFMKRSKSSSTMQRKSALMRNTMTGGSMGVSSLFGVSEGQSAIDNMSLPNQKKKPSLRLTKSLLLKSVVEASIIEPVQRHLPNVHGKNKFSHFSQDRVITSFGGGLDFKNYKPL